MITQISLTAWIVCTANGIYASHMDHIWIAYGSHTHCGQKHAAPCSVRLFRVETRASRQVDSILNCSYSKTRRRVMHHSRLAREACINKWIGRYFPFQAVLISCREERKQSLLRGRRC